MLSPGSIFLYNELIHIMKNHLAIIALLMSLTTSCVYPFKVSLDGIDDMVVVIEGNIAAGGTSTVKFSKIYTSEDTDFVAVLGTAVVEDERGGVYESTSTVPGMYQEIPMENADPSLKYRMKVEVNGLTYVSEWLKPLEPPEIEDVAFSADADNVTIDVTMETGKDATGYLGLYFDETWEFHTKYKSLYYYAPQNPNATLYGLYVFRGVEYENYWCWRNKAHPIILVDYTNLYNDGRLQYPVQSFPRTDSRNHKKYSIEVKAVTLSENYFIFLKNLQKISEGDRSLFSPNPGEVSCNISCESNPDRMVAGYVTANRMSTPMRGFLDSRYLFEVFDPSDLVVNPRYPWGKPEIDGLPIDTLSLSKGKYGTFIKGMYWAPMHLCDCIAAGGTKEKPDFW